MTTAQFTIDCTGDACTGDTILFTETVWGGSYRKPYRVGDRTIAAKVLRDSYGAAKQQHTFTLQVLWSHGVDPLAPGQTTTRKGRNIYRNGTRRMPWDDEAERRPVLDDKHSRGASARRVRAIRREAEMRFY